MGSPRAQGPKPPPNLFKKLLPSFVNISRRSSFTRVKQGSNTNMHISPHGAWLDES